MFVFPSVTFHDVLRIVDAETWTVFVGVETDRLNKRIKSPKGWLFFFFFWARSEASVIIPTHIHHTDSQIKQSPGLSAKQPSISSLSAPISPHHHFKRCFNDTGGALCAVTITAPFLTESEGSWLCTFSSEVKGERIVKHWWGLKACCFTPRRNDARLERKWKEHLVFLFHDEESWLLLVKAADLFRSSKTDRLKTADVLQEHSDPEINTLYCILFSFLFTFSHNKVSSLLFLLFFFFFFNPLTLFEQETPLCKSLELALISWQFTSKDSDFLPVRVLRLPEALPKFFFGHWLLFHPFSFQSSHLRDVFWISVIPNIYLTLCLHGKTSIDACCAFRLSSCYRILKLCVCRRKMDWARSDFWILSLRVVCVRMSPGDCH